MSVNSRFQERVFAFPGNFFSLPKFNATPTKVQAELAFFFKNYRLKVSINAGHDRGIWSVAE
jgi:hypothetical protein